MGCTVASVHDGDTLRVICSAERQTIRLACIDAPELAQNPWGNESRDYLRRIAGRSVQVTAIDKDRYGRTIANIRADGREVNLEMVRSGRAVVYQQFCQDMDYYQAETQARREKLGVWGKEGGHQRPWEYRARAQ